MKKAAIFALLVGSFLYASQEHSSGIWSAVEHNGWLKAGDYLKLTSEYQRMYVIGLLDGWYMAPIFHAPDHDKYLVGIASCVEGMKGSQVAAIVEKYIREHPERWDWDAKDESSSAMLDACRKRGFIKP
jgi:hypothetical protein